MHGQNRDFRHGWLTVQIARILMIYNLVLGRTELNVVGRMFGNVELN